MFVAEQYADMDTKLKRCIERAPEGEKLTRTEHGRKIREIDKERTKHRGNICINLDTQYSVRRTSNAHARGHFAKKFYVCIADFSHAEECPKCGHSSQTAEAVGRFVPPEAAWGLV